MDEKNRHRPPNGMRPRENGRQPAPAPGRRMSSSSADQGRTRTLPPARQPQPSDIQDSRKYKKSRRLLRKRVTGRPSRSMSVVSVPAAIWSGAKKALVLALVLFLAALAFIGGSGLGILSGYISTARPLEIVDVKETYEATYIYDRNGNQAAVLTGSQNILREYVPIAIIKATYIDDAFIAIEDERFESHHGIDPRRIANSVGQVFLSMGGDTHGASTITQQVGKMMSGADDRSAQRKVQEWERAIALEKNLSKDEIMELFVNMVPMGGQYVGVQSAAKAYFGKDVSQLDLAECAFLAGIPNLPSIYNPATEYGKRNALRRMRIILGKMLEIGKITDEEYQQALNRELVFRTSAQDTGTSSVNSYFVDAVINEVIEQLISQRGYTRQLANVAVFQHGLTIETTMDPDIQAMAEASFNKKELFSANYDGLPDSPQIPQGAITVISNQSDSFGQIVAMVGGFGEKKKNLIFNRATQAYRQPGSSIKPVLVYAPAIDTGLVTAASVFIDEEKHLDPQNPTRAWPRNSGGGYNGAVTVRRALRQSLNTIAVEIYTEVMNPSIGLSYMKRMGVDRSNEPQPAGALGAFTWGMNSIEMAGMYTALANRGLFTEPYLFTRVLDAQGNVLLEHKPRLEQVFTTETADLITNLLVDTARNAGWISPFVSIGKQPVAGKTGTSDERIDRWFCGYTPYYTAAVWYGYDNANGRRTEIPSADVSSPIKIWRDVMYQIHANLDVKQFPMSSGLVTRKVCADSGMLPTEWCTDTITEYFDSNKKHTFPALTCTLHSEAPPDIDPENPDDPDPDPTGPTIIVTPDPDPTSPTSPPEEP